MFSCSPELPQYYSPPPKVQSLILGQLPSVFGLATTQMLAYLQKVLDIKTVVGIMAQQLSNSATQQLSNSATQQLSNSATQHLDCALKNGRIFQLDNNIIIFSHQFLQTAQVVLGFFILNRKGR